MKHLIIFLFVVFLIGCSSNDDSNSTSSFDSFGDFERVIYQFQFYKNPNVNANCNASQEPSELKVSLATGIFVKEGLSSGEQASLQHGYLESILNDSNSSTSISILEDDTNPNFRKIILVNNVKLRNENGEHDFSYFQSLSDTIKIDIDVTGLDFFDTSSNYSYQKKQANTDYIECRSGWLVSIEHYAEDIDAYGGFQTYLDEVFHGYRIEGNKLILIEPIAL